MLISKGGIGMTHFQKRLKQLDAVEQLLWIVLALMVVMLVAGGEREGVLTHASEGGQQFRTGAA